MLPEFESAGWWQRPHTRGRCTQCKCSLVENPSFRSSKCHGCEKQMKTKSSLKRLDGIVFTNADPRYAGKLDDPQGGDTTMLMQQRREVMTVNQEMEDESNWIWLWGFRCGRDLRTRITVKPEVRNNATTSVLIKQHFCWRLPNRWPLMTRCFCRNEKCMQKSACIGF